ncbi:MAG TPA: pyrroline-5-carboxylate reductase [Burkholderiaceae bacterium]|nr:pyrroline-5-carboxylate reductase [Burkholderiaceae bacterium]
MNIVFIGGGNMATALIAGLLREGLTAAAIRVVEVDPGRLAALKRELGVDGSAAPDAALRGADAVVFAVKPQHMQAACTQCRPWLGDGFALTIAAGIPAASVAAWSGRLQVVRAMPNTPALIGAGITGLWAGTGLSPQARSLAERIMSAAGDVVWFDEEAMLDAVTAISGSGPAYVFFFIEALQAAAEAMGMTAEQARHLSVATFRGAALLASQSDEPVAALRERVTSKGGTTAAALEKISAFGLRERFIEAVFAALERSRELARTYGESDRTL